MCKCHVPALRFIVPLLGLSTSALLSCAASGLFISRVSSCDLVGPRMPGLGSFVFGMAPAVCVCFRVCHLCFCIALAAHPYMYLRSLRFAFTFGDEFLGRSICHLWMSWVHIGITQATAIVSTVFLWLVVFVSTGSLPRACLIDCLSVCASMRMLCVCTLLQISNGREHIIG